MKINKRYYKFSNAQKQAIAEAREQIKRGQFISNSKANKEINEWLKSNMVIKSES